MTQGKGKMPEAVRSALESPLEPTSFELFPLSSLVFWSTP